MSIKVMSWVWEKSPSSGSGLLLLLAIADFADDDGIAFPSIPKLAKKTRMSRASVFRAIGPLVESGQLKIETHGGGRDTNEYQIIMTTGLNLTPLESQDETPSGLNLTPHPSQNETSEVSERDGSGLNSETAAVSLLRHRTVNESSVVTTTTSSPPPDGGAGQRDGPPKRKPNPLARFDEFWKTFPLKKGKPAAQKAFAKAVTGGADPQAIIDGAIAYALECRMKEPKFIKYPQGWLNDGRWQDEADRAPSSPAQREIATCGTHLLPLPCRSCAADAKGAADDPWTRQPDDPTYEPPF